MLDLSLSWPRRTHGALTPAPGLYLDINPTPRPSPELLPALVDSTVPTCRQPLLGCRLATGRVPLQSCACTNSEPTPACRQHHVADVAQRKTSKSASS